VLSDIGVNPEKSEYSLRIIEAVIKISSPEFPEKYWKFEDVFSEEKIN
jgi:hypothetical protein